MNGKSTICYQIINDACLAGQQPTIFYKRMTEAVVYIQNQTLV